MRNPVDNILAEQLKTARVKADAAAAEVVRQANELAKVQAELCETQVELEQMKASTPPPGTEIKPDQLSTLGEALERRYISISGWGTKYVSLSQKANDLARQLSEAVIAWRPPSKMVQGIEVIITAAIAYTPDRTLAIEFATGSGALRATSREITESMYVLLTSDESGVFHIEKLDEKQPDEQVVRPGAATYWQWRVTPLVEGNHTLRLQPYVVFVRDGNREKKQRLAVAPELITVSVSHPYQAQRFWREYKPAALSVFIFPFLAWGVVTGYRRVRLKFQRKPADPPVIIWTP